MTTTPLFHSFRHSENQQKEILYKMECFQPSGSFKIRGIGLLCQRLAAEGISRFVCASGGNAGLAVAYSGYQLGIETIVVVPESTRESMRQRILEFGAKLEIKGAVWNDAHRYACQLAEEAGSFYVHPFDHTTIWEGHASIVEELAAETEEPDAIVLAVGGGGLFCGVMQGLQNVGWENCRVICAETEGAASLARSLAAGQHITLNSIDTIATSLGAKRIANRAWEWAQAQRVQSFTCSDAATLKACRLFLDEYRVLTEPACGAALAAVYEQSPLLASAKKIIVIVCGGAAMNLDDMLALEVLLKI